MNAYSATFVTSELGKPLVLQPCAEGGRDRSRRFLAPPRVLADKRAITTTDGAAPSPAARRYRLLMPLWFSSPVSSTARNAFCGMSTWPIDFIRFLPSFCFSHNLRLRLMSPP